MLTLRFIFSKQAMAERDRGPPTCYRSFSFYFAALLFAGSSPLCCILSHLGIHRESYMRSLDTWTAIPMGSNTRIYTLSFVYRCTYLKPILFLSAARSDSCSATKRILGFSIFLAPSLRYLLCLEAVRTGSGVYGVASNLRTSGIGLT